VCSVSARITSIALLRRESPPSCKSRARRLYAVERFSKLGIGSFSKIKNRETTARTMIAYLPNDNTLRRALYIHNVGSHCDTVVKYPTQASSSTVIRIITILSLHNYYYYCIMSHTLQVHRISRCSDTYITIYYYDNIS